MTELAVAVDADDELWTLDDLPTTPYVQVEDEIIEVRSKFPSQTYSLTGQESEPRIRVQRGIGGTTAASHNSGSVLTPVYVPSTGEGGVAAFSGVDMLKSDDQEGETVGGSFKVVTWDGVNYDTDSYRSGNTIVIPATGYYLVTASLIGYDDDAVDGTAYLAVQKNASGTFLQAMSFANGVQNQFIVPIAQALQFAAADVLTLKARFNPVSGGTAFNILANTRWSVTRLAEL